MMAEEGKNYANGSGALYPIRTVSALTNVKAITLRAWESRYGLIKPVRKDSGHRLYSQADIDVINRTVSLLDSGMRIGQVKAELDRQGVSSAETAGGRQNIWQKHIDHMQAAVIRFDETALDRSYSEMLALYPVKEVTERLLTPLLRQLGDRWADGMGSIAEEHFFGFYLRSKLGARLHHRTRHGDGRLLLLACLPNDHHEIGLLILALAACERQFSTLILGANMPLGELAGVAKKSGSSAIVLSGVIAQPPVLYSQQLPALVRNSEVPVFIGGPCSMDTGSIERAGAIACGTDLEVGMSRIEEHLLQINGRTEDRS